MPLGTHGFGAAPAEGVEPRREAVAVGIPPLPSGSEIAEDHRALGVQRDEPIGSPLTIQRVASRAVTSERGPVPGFESMDVEALVLATFESAVVEEEGPDLGDQ